MGARWDRRLEQGYVSGTGKAWFLKTAAAWLLNWLATAPTRGAKGSLWLNTTNGLPYTNVGTPGSEVWASPNVFATEAVVAPGATVTPTNHAAYKFTVADPGSAITLGNPAFEGQLVRFDCSAVTDPGVDWLGVTNTNGFDAAGQLTSLHFWKVGQWALLVAVRTSASTLKWRVVGSNLTPVTLRETALAKGDGEDADAVPVSFNAAYTISTVGDPDEINTLAAPTFEGQEISFEMIAKPGEAARIITVETGLDSQDAASMNNTMEFGATGDRIVLKGTRVGADLRWRIMHNNAVVLSHV